MPVLWEAYAIVTHVRLMQSICKKTYNLLDKMQVLWEAYAIVTHVRLMRGICKNTYNMPEKSAGFMVGICCSHTHESYAWHMQKTYNMLDKCRFYGRSMLLSPCKAYAGHMQKELKTKKSLLGWRYKISDSLELKKRLAAPG
jgi:hypothetical protein